jgi:hypothetical protein
LIGARGGLHDVQTIAPAKLTDPASHVEHAVAPITPEKFPALHCRQTLDEDADSVVE